MSRQRIGRYEILRPLGRGAMGVVYLARDPQIEREVALKTVRFDGPQQNVKVDEAKARFLKEARISGRLQHPHIVTVFDVGEDAGNLYLAMEYVAGGSFSQRLSDPKPFPIEERIRIVAEVAQALGHAHERGVIHRDVKPANILLTESLKAKVTDFGIGKFLSGDIELTSTGQMVGSPAYMSPEQVRGEKLDVRSDIFSLGVVLYQALTDRKPFPADTLTTLVYQILHEEPPDPGALRNDLPEEITGIVRKCLAKAREDRFSDAGELATALGELLGIAPVVSTASLSESKVRRAQRVAMARLEAETPAPPKMETDSDTPTIAVSGTVEVPVRKPPPPTDSPTVANATPRARSRGPAVALVAAGLLLAAAAAVFVLRRAGEPKKPPVRPAALPAATAATTPATSLAAATPAPVPTESIRVVETPLAEPTPAPTKKPRVKPTAAVVAPTAVAAAPTPLPAQISYVVKRIVKVNVAPSQARLFLDGKYIGISDDWDGSGGGALLVFNIEGKHRLRFTYPGRNDLLVDVSVTASAIEDRIEIERELEKGSPGGSTGPEGKIRRPDYKTVGPVRFNVEPPDADVTVNGKDLGKASQWAKEDLPFRDMAVYDVELSAPGHESKTVRVIVAPSTEEVRAVVKEKLKKRP